MGKTLVKVKTDSFPVRYAGVTYKTGEELEVQSEHALHPSFEVLEEMPAADTGDVDKNGDGRITVDEIKARLDELGIDYKGVKKRDDLLALLPAE